MRLSPTKRKNRKPKHAEPALTVADYYRMKLDGLLSPTQPTYEEYLSHSTP